MRSLTLTPKQRFDKRADGRTRVGRTEFDQVVKTSILESVRMVGDDYLDLILSFLQERNGIRDFDLEDVDAALDSVFSRFSIAIKHVIMFQICSTLKIEPQKLLKTLEWTIQEIRSSCW
ncbi:MAG TPA: hypothetical protein VGS11_11625 [Candidatus Bathyarchaeia archaeon]|nr:hypothetical protein [Candidatus Bathyarchaeia archaeon]